MSGTSINNGGWSAIQTPASDTEDEEDEDDEIKVEDNNEGFTPIFSISGDLTRSRALPAPANLTRVLTTTNTATNDGHTNATTATRASPLPSLPPDTRNLQARACLNSHEADSLMDGDGARADEETRSKTLSTGRTPSRFDSDEGPDFNARRSRMFRRFIEASDSTYGSSIGHATGASQFSTATPANNYVTPTFELDKPVPPTAHERANASKRQAQFAFVNGELLDRTAAVTLQVLAVAGVNKRRSVAGRAQITQGSSTAKDRMRSATYRADPFIDDESRANTPSAGRAPSIVVDDVQELVPEHHARDKSVIARPLEAASLGAAYRVDPLAPRTGANAAVQPTPLVPRNPITTVPPIPRVDSWSNGATRAHGSGNINKTNGLEKPKFPPKQRAEAMSSTANTTSAPPSARAMSNALSVGTIDHPIDVDAPTEELQAQAEGWATLVLSFAKSKNTRVRDHRPLVNALNDASVACLSARILVDSGLYAAMRALSGLDVAGEMFGAVNMAKRLAKRWKKRFGDALNEEV